MKINYLRAQNFLSIGEEPVEIDFTKYSNIINLKGENLDLGDGASNGAGKSSIINSITYALYGKLIKNMSHKEAINIKSKRGLEVELHWKDNDNSYKIIRRRAPDKLELWQNNENISLGGIPATDELLKGIIKLNHNSFINVACFGQHNLKSFLGCTPSEKRQIAENLLSLDRYVKYQKTVKDKVKAMKDKIFELSTKYESYLQQLSASRKKYYLIISQQEQWKEKQQQEIEFIQSKIIETNKKLLNLNLKPEVNDYQKDQEQLMFLESEVEKKEKNRKELYVILTKVDNSIEQKRSDKHDLTLKISNAQREIAIITNEVNDLEAGCNQVKSTMGATCSYCFGEIGQENVSKIIKIKLERIKELQIQLIEQNKIKKENEDLLLTCNSILDKLLEGRKAAREKEIMMISSANDMVEKKNILLKKKKPDTLLEINLVKKDLEFLNEKLQKEKENKNPYIEMLHSLNEDVLKIEGQVETYKKEIKSLEGEIPYYEFWVKGFGDNGIRSFAISEIVPTLNARVNYWLERLMEGKLQIHFDEQLNEIIQKVPTDNDPFIYNSLSGGELCRLDLAVTQAFAYVISMNAGGVLPSVVFFDEIATNLDRVGVHSVYNMISEISKDRQVIIVSHDPDMQSLIENDCDTIIVQKKNGLTTLKK